MNNHRAQNFAKPGICKRKLLCSLATAALLTTGWVCNATIFTFVGTAPWTASYIALYPHCKKNGNDKGCVLESSYLTKIKYTVYWANAYPFWNFAEKDATVYCLILHTYQFHVLSNSVKDKFHYAIQLASWLASWFASWSATSRRPAAKLAADQLWTSLQPGSSYLDVEIVRTSLWQVGN